jgi:hypothetical protein
MLRLTLVALMALSIAGCDPGKFLAQTAGGAGGSKAGTQIARAKPIDLRVGAASPRGGGFCDAMAILGWPPHISLEDAARYKDLSPTALAVVVNTLKHGAAECGWKAR